MGLQEGWPSAASMVEVEARERCPAGHRPGAVRRVFVDGNLLAVFYSCGCRDNLPASDPPPSTVRIGAREWPVERD